MSCDNHTLSVDTQQLQTRYNDLIMEKSQLKTNYNILGQMNDQLSRERDKLQNKLSNIGLSFLFRFQRQKIFSCVQQ